MNPDLINLLISLDKNAENFQGKSSKEISNVSSPKQMHSPRVSPIKFTSVAPQQIIVSKQDRRARRTLRAKVNCILNSLPEPCQHLSKKHSKSTKNLKRKKIEEINSIRKKNGKNLINLDDFSISDEFDHHGNIIKQTKQKSVDLTPKKALKEKLSPKELEMLKEDPVYFIQNQKYKYKIKLNDDENWEKLIDEDENSMKPNTNKVKSYFVKEKNSLFLSVRKDEDEIKKKYLDEKIKNKIDKAVKQKEEFKRKITKKFQEKFKSYKEKKFSKEMIKLNGMPFNSDEFFDAPKIRMPVKNHSEKHLKAQEFLDRKRKIDDRIMEFLRHAREAEDIHSQKLKELAISKKIKSAKEKLRYFHKNEIKDVQNLAMDKIMINYFL